MSGHQPTKHYYQAHIQYIGTGYAGFQYQKEIPTIQNDFNQAIKNIVNGKITTMGASRTDTGVHALKQIVKVTSENFIECSSLMMALQKILPSQIKCLDFSPCPGEFKPSSQHQSKEYRYYFTNLRNVPQDNQKFISNFSIPLNFNDMQVCLKHLLGTHDFKNFYSAGSNVKSTVRNITTCELTEINPHDEFSISDLFNIPQNLQNCYELRIVGNGFLKQMVRHIVSALWMVGSGKLSTDDFINLLNGPKVDKKKWRVAAPNGLFLYEITY